MIRRRLALAATMLVLAACQRHAADEDTTPVANDDSVAPAPAPAPAPPPPPAPVLTTNTADDDLPPKPKPPSVDQQMQDDADATGMTSRYSDNAAAASGDDAAGAVTNRD